jgi:segregation and condensation protein B
MIEIENALPKEISVGEAAESEALSPDAQAELNNIVEAALLAADEPLSVTDLMSLFPAEAPPPRASVSAALDSLAARCADRGIELRRIGKGWRFQSREQYAPWLRRLSESRPPRYSRALLETLAIVAYRQPVTRGDIEEIRGVSVSSEIMHTLVERGWVRQVGAREVPGRPALFGTTPVFLEYFNLQGLSDLPGLPDQRALGEIARDMNLQLPFDAPPADEDSAETDAPAHERRG